jgi:hypothetical protein
MSTWQFRVRELGWRYKREPSQHTDGMDNRGARWARFIQTCIAFSAQILATHPRITGSVLAQDKMCPMKEASLVRASLVRMSAL